MSYALLFWIGMFIWLIGGVLITWPNQKLVAGNILLFILLLLLGLDAFGPAVHR